MELYSSAWPGNSSPLGSQRPSSCVTTTVSLKLLVNQMAVSRGETLPGPNGRSSTFSSSYLPCCSSLALNSSRPSRASARCWYELVSNRCRRESDDPRLEPSAAAAAAAGEWSEESLWSPPSTRKICTVHLSLVMERSPQLGVLAAEPRGRRGSSQEARGNSAIRSILGAFTETSGERMLSRKLRLGLRGVLAAGRGRDALRPCRSHLPAGVISWCRWKFKIARRKTFVRSRLKQKLGKLHATPKQKKKEQLGKENCTWCGSQVGALCTSLWFDQ